MPEDPNQLVEIYHKSQSPDEIEVFGTQTRQSYKDEWKAKGWLIRGESNAARKEG